MFDLYMPGPFGFSAMAAFLFLGSPVLAVKNGLSTGHPPPHPPPHPGCNDGRAQWASYAQKP